MRPNHSAARMETRGRAGQALVELALLSPWIIFLFLGILDVGFYSYALICSENAARAGALYASNSEVAANDGPGICSWVLSEMRVLPNVGSALSCTCGAGICTAGPITIESGFYGPSECPDGGGGPCAQVEVRYTTIQMFPLPLLPGRLRIERMAQTPVKAG